MTLRAPRTRPWTSTDAMPTDALRIDTLLAQAGCNIDPTTGALVEPPYLTTTFEREPDGSYPRGYTYTRSENPTRHRFEETLARIEEGYEAAAFASGTAATAAVFQALQPGDHVILADDAYYGTRRALGTVFREWGLSYDEVDMTAPENVEAAARPETRLVWAESPSNPRLKITDLEAVAGAAHALGAFLLVDNTFATPVLQRPLSLGADLVLHSVTKYLSGHTDVMGGAVVAREESHFFEKIRHVQTACGAIFDPFSAWLALRGMRTLAARIRMQCATARQVAAYLNNHPRVERTHYPGLLDHPGHRIAQHQMADFGGMLSFEVTGGREAAMEVAARVHVFRRATSLGGTESLIEHRASVEPPPSPAPEGLLRLSIGLEHVDDLVSDLSEALG